MFGIDLLWTDMSIVDVPGNLPLLLIYEHCYDVTLERSLTFAEFVVFENTEKTRIVVYFAIVAI